MKTGGFRAARSPANCGGCDRECSATTPHTRATCQEGQCGTSCETGWSDANADATDGCEIQCTPTSPPNEICDGLDNDCDTGVDEAFPSKGKPCTVGTGACEATGTYVCTADGSAVECDATPKSGASSETCGDDIDNDCNGQVDDGCDCDWAGNSEGVCGEAKRDASGDCTEPDNFESTVESTCDGLDNDCDGEVDEGLTVTMYPDADKDGYGEHEAGESKCPDSPGYEYNDNDCDDGDPFTYLGAPEICDDKDNNCNGRYGDDRGWSASDWCQDQYNYDNSLRCDADGPTGEICCEIDNDGTAVYECDFESVCYNGVDDDGNDGADCADPDCDGLHCADGKLCKSGNCEPI